MLTLDKKQRADLTSLLEDARFDTLMLLQNEMINELMTKRVVTEDSFTTLKETISREAKIDAINSLFDRIESESSHNL